MKFSEKGRQWFFRNNQPMNVGEKAADGFFPQMERICGVIAPSPVSFHGIWGHGFGGNRVFERRKVLEEATTIIPCSLEIDSSLTDNAVQKQWGRDGKHRPILRKRRHLPINQRTTRRRISNHADITRQRIARSHIADIPNPAQSDPVGFFT